MTGVINRLYARDQEFADTLALLLQRPEERDNGLSTTVRDIIERVRAEGDSALVSYTASLDGYSVSDVSALVIGAVGTGSCPRCP